jgi:uncharacterized zinc-type alcohol dehydrogenase-like protein
VMMSNMIRGFAIAAKGGKWEPFEYDAGELRANEVEIKVLSCGICHADLSMAQNDWGMTTYPFVGGHEVYGEVARVGANVTSVRVGQKAGVGWRSGACWDCTWCRRGDDNLCDGAYGTIVGRHGGFADKIRVESQAAVPVPEGYGGDETGPLFCGGVAVFAPIMEYVRPGHKVGVIGIGGLGSMAVQFLKHWGCHVTAFTSSEAKRKTALELGAHATISSVDEAELQAAAGSFDVVISTVDVKLNWNLIIGTLTKRGRLHTLGAVAAPLEVAAFPLLLGHKCVSSSPTGSFETIRAMLAFAQRHDIKPQVQVLPFAKINEAFEQLAKNGQGRLVLKW